MMTINGMTQVLDRLALLCGLLRAIGTENGKEFCGEAMVSWAQGHDVLA